jgi:RNA polymerase sigma-70 factor (ECF subfamily)
MDMADGQMMAAVEPPRSGFGVTLERSTLDRARRGDMDAFATIYDRYGGACYTLALRVLGDRASAEDVVQDVFLKMFATVRGYRGEAPFGAWLKRLAANATIDVLRGRRRFHEDDAESLVDALSVQADTAGEQSDAWTLLMRLPPRARAVLVLHQVEGYTHRELAALFGQSESWSKSVLARALKRLGGSGAAAREDDDDDE